MYVCGAVKQNRKNYFKDLQDAKTLKLRHQNVKASTDRIVGLKWKDTKPVSFMSNFNKLDNAMLDAGE